MKRTVALTQAGLILCLLVSGPLFAAETTVLTSATAWFKTYVFNDAFWELKRRVEEKSAGKVKIEWKGGPEAIPPFESMGALSRGVIDLLHASPAYYTRIIPEAVFINYLDGKTKPLRDSGVFDFFDKIHREKAGVQLLGLTSGAVGYALFTKKPIKRLEDFRGLKLRATPLYVPIIQGLGASAVTTAPAELYTALERGVVDGFAWPALGTIDMKLHEVMCCMIRPLFYTVRQTVAVNTQAWARLKPEQQQLLRDTIIDVEEWTWERYKKKLQDEIERLAKNHGIKIIDLPEGDAKRYRQIAYEGAWKKWLPTSPQYGKQIQKMAEPFSKPWPPLY